MIEDNKGVDLINQIRPQEFPKICNIVQELLCTSNYPLR